MSGTSRARPTDSTPVSVQSLRAGAGALGHGTSRALQRLLRGVPGTAGADRRDSRVRARVPDVTFVLVGADRANGLVAHENAGGLVTAGALRIVDRQPREAMAAYLAMADVLVSPRAYGGNLPLKVFDYLAAGRPIVATDIPTHRTVLAEDRAVLVAPRTEALAEGILSVLGDPERARRLGTAARRYARRALRLEPVRRLRRDASMPRWSGMPLSAEAERRAASPDRTVSVIIPARNERRTIARLIHAIQQQAPAGWSVEVVLVDDGSTDDTVAVARDAGARVLELGSRAGGGNPAVARNRGALAAAGDPLVFLDADCLPGPGLAGANPRRPRRGRGSGGRLARPASRSPAHGPLRLLLRLVPRALPPSGGRGAQPSTRQPQRAPRRFRAYAAASPSSSRSRTLTRNWSGRRRFAGTAARSCSIPRPSSSITTGPDSATCSAGTTAGATAPSRARLRPGRLGSRGSTAIRPCWSPRASRSHSGARPTSCRAGSGRASSSRC